MSEEFPKLLSVLKVFDANYASNSDVEKLRGLDANKKRDVQIAVDLLLLEEFRSYSKQEQGEFMADMRAGLLDPIQDFSSLFRHLGLIFDNGEPLDKRAFMSAVLEKLEAEIHPDMAQQVLQADAAAPRGLN